jgi:hypothetical protein
MNPVARWIQGEQAGYACTMMRVLILLIGLVTAVGAFADVFRWVDEEGIIHFSDRPHEGAEIITLPEAQTYSAQPVRSRQKTVQPETDSSGDVGYKSLRIISPGQSEVLWNTGGTVNVEVVPEPQLQAGHNVQLFLDGQMVNGLAGAQRNFQLSEVVRGTHTVRAEIHDANGNGIFQSTAITFTVQQTSVQNPNNPSGPR